MVLYIFLLGQTQGLSLHVIISERAFSFETMLNVLQTIHCRDRRSVCPKALFFRKLMSNPTKDYK